MLTAFAPSQVQLQILTAVVKLFLKRPKEAGDLVKRVLSLATQGSDNPDVRDRGFIYWRLLSSSPEKAQLVVLASKPEIQVRETLASCQRLAHWGIPKICCGLTGICRTHWEGLHCPS